MRAFLVGDDFQIVQGGDIPADAQEVEIDASAVGRSPRDVVYDGHVIRSRASLTIWHIDAAGQWHARPGEGRQPVMCAWGDRLVRVGGVWRPQTASEAIAPLVKAECQRRIFAVATTNTQMNLTAARAAGRLSTGDQAVYAAGLDWIDAMRERCADLIVSGNADYLLDQSWPAPPDGLADLVSRY